MLRVIEFFALFVAIVHGDFRFNERTAERRVPDRIESVRRSAFWPSKEEEILWKMQQWLMLECVSLGIEKEPSKNGISISLKILIW